MSAPMEGPQVNKFERISSPNVTSGGGGRGRAGWRVWGGRQVSCTVRSNASGLMVTWRLLPPVRPNRQTDTGENLTFPQLRWKAERITALTDLLGIVTWHSYMCVHGHGRLTWYLGYALYSSVACLSKQSGRLDYSSCGWRFYFKNNAPFVEMASV